MMDSIFEIVIAKDILRYSVVKKPALFRQTFMLACQYPAQEISYNKLLGQLQEAGNALFGIEVKSKKRKTSGIAAFRKLQKGARDCYIDRKNYLEFEKDPIGFLNEYSI